MPEKIFSLTKVDMEQDIASCAACFARNYDTAHPDAIGKRVNRLYKLRIDSMVFRLCDDCLDRLSDMLNGARRSRDHAFKAGDEVHVLERDEDGLAHEVSGYMFLAEVAGRAIVTPYINDMNNLDGIMEHHVAETAENYDTDLAVFSMEDCFADHEEAFKALREEEADEPKN